MRTILSDGTYQEPPAKKAPVPVYSNFAIHIELCRRSFKFFIKDFWDEIIPEPLVWNWHMDIFCEEVEAIFKRVVGEPVYDCHGKLAHHKRQPKAYDLVVNVPPGTTKSLVFTVFAPVWGWLQDPTLKFITGSYSASLSEEHADLSRDLIKCSRFRAYFPELSIRRDKDVKSNYSNNRKGSRCTTSTGGTVTGKHAHVIIIDDPLNPKQAASDVELQNANNWMERTLSTRKVDKAITPTILVMQRLAERDPSGMMLDKAAAGKKKVRHICLPGEIFDGATIHKGDKIIQLVQPPELADWYIDGMLDPLRLSKEILHDLEADLGQYGYAGQITQQPAPPSGGMFKVQKIEVIPMVEDFMIRDVVRYWDKAATAVKENPGSAHTAGVKIALLTNGKYCIMDVVDGQWSTDDREDHIKLVAGMDGPKVPIWVEQEPGSGGKDSARSTIKNLAGYSIHAEPVGSKGNKVFRADPFSVQVNWGNVCMVRAAWNQGYIEQMSNFPFGKLKDQVDASAGGFNKIALPLKKAGVWGSS